MFTFVLKNINKGSKIFQFSNLSIFKSSNLPIFQSLNPQIPKFPNYLIFIFLLVSCGENRYPNFLKTNSGIYYKFFSIGDVEKSPQNGDFITVDLIYKTLNDSVFFTGRRNIQLSESIENGTIEECFTLMSQGDCAGFILNANSFFTKTLGTKLPSFFNPKSEMKIIVYLLDVKTKADFEKEKSDFLTWINDFGEYESKILNDFVQSKETSILPIKDGLYYLKIKEGNGVKAVTNDDVTVHYEGRFLNGGYFDSTRKRNQAFEFKLGTEWQVIEGLERAIRTMSEGEKAIFIMKSNLAFGVKGSSTGIIPPYTPIIFEIELLKVKKDKKQE
jgi:FKBP-type peptidyl-prolyl cis-trans isomerase